MKKIFLSLIILGTLNVGGLAQNFEGVINYESVTDNAKMFANMAGRMGRGSMGGSVNMTSNNVPIKFELYVKGDESAYKPTKKQEGQEMSFEFNGQRRSFRRPLPKDEIYFNFSTKKFQKYEEYAQQPFRVSGDIEDIRWKVDPLSTKNILGYECMKATGSESIATRTMMPNEDGAFVLKDTVITNNFTVWFTDAIPGSAGPDKYNGLPGLILQADINDGVTIITATEINKDPVDSADLKINPKGKKVSPKQLQKIKDDHQEEMSKNFRGGSRGGVIIMGRPGGE